LLPTHQEQTNAIVNRNRRIGVSIIDYTGWIHNHGVAAVTTALREGYKVVRRTNKWLADEAGIPESIRVTTMKPGGTVPKLAGRTSGVGYPTFSHTIRRINVGVGTPVDLILQKSNLPFEDSAYTPNTHVYEYPILQGPSRPATDVSVWEQAMNVVLLQREWADNMVSNTLYFKPRWSKVHKVVDGVPNQYSNSGNFRIKDGWVECFNPNHEEDQLEALLAAIAPVTKSISLLPHSDVGAFAQMPEEGITKEEYERRLEALVAIDWSKLSNSDGQDEKFCTGDSCTLNT
jgi:ribonucleoside-diphosphate reductase alpha chain